MAGNREQFTLQFTADTAQAKRAMQDLNNSLSALYKAQSQSGFADIGINKAVESAKQLERHLQSAMNVNTGKLNLSTFMKSLEQSNTSLKELSGNLLQAGSAGQQTFMAMASAIAQSEVPLRQVNNTLKNFAQTLKNTVKWEISSNIVHGLEGALSGAVSYAKNLNSSLNDIRIVTNQTADDMARFAVQANKAAKELSTTTKAYADASLIYYQQGDSQEQVAKKAAITIKAANASFGSSASEMSEYLTAVWNSYQVGADELERYVDIMAALGAKTATSLEEIATSMQKVAATANTVGVSMEQVSSIISTVSSVTRESAESIGTSYKTIFARIGDLKLGDTLEDGVNLGQVSSQLDKIGVKILDANGEMRDMGTIIEELGSKWQTLSRAEQTAVAQVVAGKRQYTQLMALFENWDIYGQNMNIAQNADGSLQQMADTYAESWEAASARATASLEALYSQIINDKAIITLTNGLSGVTDLVTGLVDSFGGLAGVLGNLGAIATRIFSQQITSGIDGVAKKVSTYFGQFKGQNMWQSMKSIGTGKAKTVEQLEHEKYVAQAKHDLEKTRQTVGPNLTESQTYAVTEANNILDQKQKLIEVEHRLTEAQKQTAQAAISDLTSQVAAITALKAEKESMLQDEKKHIKDTEHAAGLARTKTDAQDSAKARRKRNDKDLLNQYEEGKDLYAHLTEQDISVKGLLDKSKSLGKELTLLDKLQQEINSGEQDVEKLRQALAKIADVDISDIDSLDTLNEKIEEIRDTAEETQEEISDLITTAFVDSKSEAPETDVADILNKAMDQAAEKGAEEASLDFELNFEEDNLESLKSKMEDLFDPESETYSQFAENFTTAMEAAGSLVAGLSVGSDLVATMSDESASLADKLGSAGGALATLASGFMSGGWIGLAASAVGMMISGITEHLKQIEETRKQLFEENNSKAQEINDANSAELNSTKNLLNTYNELYARYQAGENVQSELKTSALALADAYGLTSASVAAMTGNFELFNEEVSKTLNFADQMSDAKTALGNAGQAVTGSKKIGEVSVNMSDYLGVHTDMDNANANVAAMIQEDALMSQATALKTTDAITWDFIDEIYRQQGQMEDWSLESERMLDAFIDFASQETSNYQEAFIAALKEQGLKNTKITATTARDKILDTLKNADIEVGEFLSSFYSHALLKGSEDLSLADMGHSLAEIKSTWFGDVISYGATDAAYQISQMENLDMEAFKNIAFSQSGLKNLQEANSTNNFALDKIWSNFTDLYDSETGAFRWDDDLNAKDTVALYDRYVAWKEYLQKMLDNIVDTNSTEYQIISQFLTGVEKITDSKELSGAVTTYKEAQKNLVEWQLIENSIKGSIGKSEEDTSFTDYINFQKSLAKSVDKQYTTFDSLKEFSQDDVTNLTDEYVKAREKVVAQLISEFTAFDDYATMYSALSMSFSDTQMSAISQLIDAEELAASDITYNFIEALKTYFSSIGDDVVPTVEDLQNNTLIQSAIKISQAATAYDTNKTGRDKAVASESSFKRNMTQAEAETFYSNYWGNEKMQQFLKDRDKPLKDWTEFIAMDYDAQQAYIESISAEYSAATQESAQDIIDAHAGYIENLEGLFTEDAKKLYGDGGKIAQDNYAAWETFASLYTETDGKYMDAQGNTFDTKEAAFQNYLNLEGIELGAGENLDLTTWESFAGIMAQINAQNTQYANAQASINAGNIVGQQYIDDFANSITILQTNLDKAKDVFSGLNEIDISKMPMQGTKAYYTLTHALKGAKKSLEDYSKMSERERAKIIAEAKNKSYENLITQQANITKQYLDKYSDFAAATQKEILNSGDEKKIADYNAYIASKEAEEKLRYEQAETSATYEDEDAALAANELTAAIEAKNLVLEESKKKVEQYNTALSALTSNLESSTLSKELQTQLTQLNINYSNWGRGLEDRVKILSNVAEQTYTAQQDLLKASKIEAETYNLITTNKTDATKVITDLGNNQKAWDKWINDTFKDQANAQEAIRKYVQNMIKTNQTSAINWDSIENELKKSDTLTDQEIEIIKSKWQDSLITLARNYAKAEDEAAQEVVETWEKAFAAIAKAKEGLAKGKSIAEYLMGDEESQTALLMNYLKENPNASEEDAIRWLNSKESTISDMPLSMTDFAKLSDASAVDRVSGRLFSDQSTWEKVVDRRAEEDARAAGNTTEEAIEQYVANVWSELLKTNGVQDRNELWNKSRAEAITHKNDYNQQQIKSDIDVAKTKFDTAYEDQNAAQQAWQKVYEAAGAVQSGQADKISTYLKDDMVGILAAINDVRDADKQLTAGDLDRYNLESANAEIQTADASIQAAKVTLSGELDGIDTEGTAMEGYKQDTFKEASASAEESAMAAQSEADIHRTSVDNTITALSSMSSDFKALETVQKEFLTKTGVTAESLAELGQTLDQTNPAIMTAYQTLSDAAQSQDATALAQASHDLTSAIIIGNGAMLESNAATEAMLKSWKELYGITDEQGEALSVAAVNQMRFAEAEKNTYKQLKSGIKILKANGKEYKKLNEGIEDISKAAKKAGKPLSDFVDEAKDMSKEDKEVVKTLGDMYEAFEELEDDFGDPTFGEEFLDQCLSAEEGTNITGMAFDAIMNQIGGEDGWSNLFDNALTGLETGTYQFSDAAIAMINEAGLDVETCMTNMMAALEAAGGNWGTVDWGTLANTLGVDMSWIISMLTELLQAYIAANNIEGVDVGALIGQVQNALSAANNVQGKYGGAGVGSGAKNSMPHAGGKGGGGGSKDKDKEKKEKLRYEDEVERYHEQKQLLDRTGETLDMIDKLKDRAYGKNHVAQLEAETKALKDQLNAQADLYNEANKWRASDQKELISLGVGIQFDEWGNIANYEEVMKALIDKQNANIERYNNSEQEEGDKLRLEADEQWYEDAVQAIEDYEEAIKEGNEALIEMEEIRNKISELELEKITYKLEIETELNENDLELFEYYVEKWEDDLDKQDESFIKVTDQISVYQNNLTNLSNALAELNEQHQNGTINEADYAEGMQDIQDQILENLENLEDAGESLKEIYSNALELAREEIDRTTEAIEHSREVMESYISIMGLMGKANDFDSLQAFYEAQYTYGLQQIKMTKDVYDDLIAARSEYDAKLAAGQQLNEIELKNYKALQEQIMEAENAMLDATQVTLEAIKAGYENTVNAMSKNLEEFMVGAGNSIAGLADQYAYFQEKQDRYVSTAKELFEVSKLNRDIENSLADATTDASKEALKALQEKINKQSELNELTEYDIQMNQLEYQLLLARIQLEEASSSKDTVRLTRDANGNYAYQYTADQDKVNEAMQQYEDVLQQINELSVERTGEIEQLMIDAMQNNMDKFNEIMLDETLSTEQRNQKIADLNTQFSETMLYLQEQAAVAGEKLTWNQEMIADHFGVALGDITASTAGNVNDSVQAMIQKADEFAAKMNAVLTGDGKGSVTSVWADYKNKLQEVSDTSGLNYETMTNKIGTFTSANELAAESANRVMNTLKDTLAPLTALTAAWGVHASAIDDMIGYYEALAEAMNQTMRDNAGEGGSVAGGAWKQASTAFEDKGYGPYEITLPDGTKITHNATGPWSALAMAGVAYSEIAKVSVIPKFRRGGLADFTGLAQLDGTKTDPELVLNADDTRNMLDTVRVVRQLDANTLSLLVSTLETSVNSMMAFMGSSYHAFGVSSPQTQTLDQNVQITAEFPNVTDHNEIEEAFNSLVNRAAQFAKQR